MPATLPGTAAIVVCGLVVTACCVGGARKMARLLDSAQQREKQFALELRASATQREAADAARPGATRAARRKKSKKADRQAYTAVSKDDEQGAESGGGASGSEAECEL